MKFSPIELSSYEEQIYNCWLQVQREAQNKPFRARLRFDSLSLSQKHALKKIAQFLERRFPYNNSFYAQLFFEAPFGLERQRQRQKQHNSTISENFYPLDYYCSAQAYQQFCKWLDYLIVKQPLIFRAECIRSAIFVAQFCTQNNILWENYYSIQASQSLPYWILHTWHKHVFFLFHFHNPQFSKHYENLDFSLRQIYLAPYHRYYEIFSKPVTIQQQEFISFLHHLALSAQTTLKQKNC